MKTLQDLFLTELSDIYDAEKRLVKALPKLAKAATSKELQETIFTHQKETVGHVEKLEQVFKCFQVKATGQTCEATVGLLEEAEEMMTGFKGSPVINAALIAAAQKMEHYEMASYGCLHEWAGLLGNEEAAGLLQEILQEESAANEALTKLAVDACNNEALGGSAVKRQKPASKGTGSASRKPSPPISASRATLGER